MLRGLSLAALASITFISGAGVASAAETLDYSAADPELKAVLLDKSPTESFLAVRADSQGRLFVGGREALFVYEPNDKGGYLPRKELFRFPNHTWVYNVEIRGDDVYALTVSALYVFPGARLKHEGVQPKRLVWGVPMGHVHQCFHGMAWGPDGYLYFSMGDPLWYYGDFQRPDHWGHWTFFSQPEGTKLPYTGVGGVFKCLPDGSDFQIVARGLRNSCGLAFDRQWNLFTNDNDHEGMPAEYVPGRLIHVTPHAYFNWPRGWMLDKTPDRADILETMTKGMGRAVPVDQSYYDEQLFPAKYRNELLVARWGRRTVSRYPLQPRGASFKTDEELLLVGRNEARPVGVSVGRGGRVFVTISYMAQNEGSPTYRSDLVMITPANDAADHPFDAYDASTAPLEKLWSELSNPSWWPRNRAHIELARRGGEVLAQATERLANLQPDDPARYHLPWLAGMSNQPAAGEALTKLLESSDAGVRLQAIRALSEFAGLKASRDLFLKAVADPSDPVKLAAVLAFFKFDGPVPSEIIEGPARSKDTYLRQAATILLAEKSSLDELTALCQSKDAATRLAGTLAAGFRLTLPPATAPIADRFPLDPQRTEEAYVIHFADAKVDLRKHGRVGNFTVADHWKVGGHTPEQERLFALLLGMTSDSQEPVRLQAAHFLYMLNDPRSEPVIAKVTTASQELRLSVAPLVNILNVWLVGPFPDGKQGFKKIHPPEQGPVDLAAEFEVDGAKVGWKEAKTARFFNLTQMFGTQEDTSYYAYCRLQSPKAQLANLLVGSDDGIEIWHNGKKVWVNEIHRAPLPYQDVVPLKLEAGSNDLLVRVNNLTGDSGFYLTYRSLGEVVATMPEKMAGNLAERLKGAATGDAKIGPEFLQLDWRQEVAKGDVARGKKLFEADGLGCVKCHLVSAEQAGGNGPSLGDAGKRFTVPHLVESILAPNKEISPVFKATLVATTSGEQVTGLVIGETADKVELLLPNATKRTIAKKDIEARRLQNLSPMPNGLVKKPDELRDILAYLMSEKSQTAQKQE